MTCEKKRKKIARNILPKESETRMAGGGDSHCDLFWGTMALTRGVSI